MAVIRKLLKSAGNTNRVPVAILIGTVSELILTHAGRSRSISLCAERRETRVRARAVGSGTEAARSHIQADVEK
jgi:hypothetical protein